MFALAFDAIFNFIFGVALIYGIYRLAFRKSLAKEAEAKAAKIAAVKLSIVKIHSNDYNDINNFLNNNAQYLPEETIEKLASKLESLKTEHFLNQRFEDLETRQRVSIDSEVHDNEEDLTEFSSITNRKI